MRYSSFTKRQRREWRFIITTLIVCIALALAMTWISVWLFPAQ